MARYGWSLGDAQGFLICGERPHVYPLRIDQAQHPYFGYPLLRIEVAQWVPAETMAKVVRLFQGRSPRGPRGQRNLALYGFVQKHLHSKGRRAKPTWKELQDHWNQERPEFRYGNWRTMARDYGRAVAALGVPDPRKTREE
jgi:hypothetical protein